MMVPKFRAWDETQHKMLQVDFIEFIDGKAYWVEASPADAIVQGENYGPIGDNSQLKLEQFTGLKDANGKDVYESDLLKITHPFNYNGEIGEVKWSNSDAEFIVGNFQFWEVASKSVVIGNVHENPELLEDKK